MIARPRRQMACALQERVEGIGGGVRAVALAFAAIGLERDQAPAILAAVARPDAEPALLGFPLSAGHLSPLVSEAWGENYTNTVFMSIPFWNYSDGRPAASRFAGNSFSCLNELKARLHSL